MIYMIIRVTETTSSMGPIVPAPAGTAVSPGQIHTGAVPPGYRLLMDPRTGK